MENRAIGIGDSTRTYINMSAIVSLGNLVAYEPSSKNNPREEEHPGPGDA